MTPEEREKEYIITGEQMYNLYSMIYIRCEQPATEILQKVHSCPVEERKRTIQEQAWKEHWKEKWQREERERVLGEALNATDECWRRMHHGMKRDLFLRFRKSIESIRSKGNVP